MAEKRQLIVYAAAYETVERALDDQFQGVAAEIRRGHPRSVCEDKPGYPRYRTVCEDR